MRTWKLAIPAGIVISGFLFCTTATYGKQEYMKKENLKSCNACHSKMGAPEVMKVSLNDLGTCYSKNDHSLAKCKVPDDVKK